MHLTIGIPCYGGLVTQRYMESVCNLLQYGSSIDLAISVEMIGYESLITRGRNTIVSKFLDSPTATHLMFIDADIGFTPDQVMRLLEFDQMVVAGMYPLKIVHYDRAMFENLDHGEALETAQINYVGTPERGEALEVVDGFATGVVAGAGFLMMKREALDLLIKAYPETHYTMAHNAAEPSRSPNQYALFDCLIEPDTGHYLSEDYAFCHRWRALGQKLWLDIRSKLMHIGPREYAGDAGTRFDPALLRALGTPVASKNGRVTGSASRDLG
jgi:hypothetical protein